MRRSNDPGVVVKVVVSDRLRQARAEIALWSHAVRTDPLTLPVRGGSGAANQISRGNLIIIRQSALGQAEAAVGALLPEQVSAALIPRLAKSVCVLRFARRCARIRHVNLEALRSQFLTDGYCCIENVVPVERVEEIRESVARDVWAHSWLERPTGYVPGFLRVNQSLAPYLASEAVLGLVRRFFGPHVRISMLTGTVNAPDIPRGALHADWPYNQASAAHIPAPYPDCILHIVTFWMLSDFTTEGGGTIIVPGSHRRSDHPRPGSEIDPTQPYPGERQLLGNAGTVALLDARMWHAVAPNRTDRERVAVIVRYAPWWLNLDPLRPGTLDRQEIVEAQNGKDSQVPPLPRDVFENLPADVKPLLRYSVTG
jgi:phytanoyl-CoA dioxygenase PhyH